MGWCVSTVSRMAQAWLYGPKYLVPLRLAPRITWTRGYSSPIVTARYGELLSSGYLTLNLGSNSLIQEYSSCSASTSVPTTVHSTPAAVLSIIWVRGCRLAKSAKEEVRRCLRDFAFPTLRNRPRRCPTI